MCAAINAAILYLHKQLQYLKFRDDVHIPILLPILVPQRSICDSSVIPQMRTIE